METSFDAYTIRKQIEVNASPEKVWEVLTTDHFTRQWFNEFFPGAYAESDWEESSPIRFLGPDLNGMLATIKVMQPHELLIFEYEGMVVNGVDDLESEESLAVKGGQEIYRLSSNGSKTEVAIEAGMSPEYLDQMSLSWEKALAKVKDLAEG